MMEEMAEFLKRAADRCGFTREYFREKDIPTNRQHIQVFHFFGDTRSEFILASLLLKRYKEELRGSRYLILCSWAGHRVLFPYVDEYWSPDVGSIERLGSSAIGFENHSEAFAVQQKNLNWFFDGVATFEELKSFYDNGVTKKFQERLGVVKRTLPTVPSAGVLDMRILQEMQVKPGWKVVVVPTKFIRGFNNRRSYLIKTSKEFWIKLGNRLLSEGITPIFPGGNLCHDLSPDITEAIHCRLDLSQTLGLMRAAACVLDVFNGTSRYALAARAPFVAVDDRSRYVNSREFEIDDLCAENNLPKQYIFSFSTIIESGDSASWNGGIFDGVVARLKSFLPSINRDGLPTTSERSVEVPFSVVKEHRAKRIGAKFVKKQLD